MSAAAGDRVVLHGVPARTIARTIDAPACALDGHAWLVAPGEPGRARTRLDAAWDGNRGAIVDGPVVTFEGRAWRLSVKGVGARAPLYGDTPAGYAHAHELHPALDPVARSLLGAVTRESWMGEAPYGGQGAAHAENAILLSSPALREALAPALVCPVLAVVEIPEAEIVDVFHYRRHRGPVLQEHRLVPSEVRLFHQSAIALGRDVDGALEALGVGDPAALDAFLDRFLATSVALLTVAARSVRVHGDSFEALDYDDAWLDKDAFVAPDGSLAFADLEALVHVPLPDAAALSARIVRQIERNAYETLYGADALLRTHERWTDRRCEQPARRHALAERTAIALAGDPVASLVAAADGWDLVIRPRIGEPVTVRWIDAGRGR